MIEAEEHADTVSNDAEAEVIEEEEHADTVSNEAEAEAVTKRPTLDEKRKNGLRVCTQTEVRTHIVVAYTLRFQEPDECDWPTISHVLSKETGMNQRSILYVFKRCREGEETPQLQRQGAGPKRKLAANNKGLWQQHSRSIAEFHPRWQQKYAMTSTRTATTTK